MMGFAHTFFLVYACVVFAAGGGWIVVQIVRPLQRPAKANSRLERKNRRRLLRELPAALDNDEIFLVYQPKLRLRTGEIDGVEALVRWKHPLLGGISRNVLIPLIEKSGKIRDLTVWVVRRAITEQRRLHDRGRALSVYVNISGALLTDAEFVRDVCALAATAAGPLGFEITETAFIDNPSVAMRNLRRFAEQGIAISIDDYGSGLSSLAYLKELPARELKIDKMFISGMTTSHRDPLIVRSTIDLAHALDMAVVAEGVESPATLALLKVMGCDFAQGFLISPALPIGELETFLLENDKTGPLGQSAVTLSPPKAFWTRTRRDAKAIVA
ncbi:MAG: EAL domain-containing protein [Janthinobacterium lividum]